MQGASDMSVSGKNCAPAQQLSTCAVCPIVIVILNSYPRAARVLNAGLKDKYYY